MFGCIVTQIRRLVKRMSISLANIRLYLIPYRNSNRVRFVRKSARRGPALDWRPRKWWRRRESNSRPKQR